MVREGRDDRDDPDGLDGLDVGINMGRVLLRDRRELSNGDLSYCDPPSSLPDKPPPREPLFFLPKKMEVMISSTSNTRKTIKTILIIRAKPLAADV